MIETEKESRASQMRAFHVYRAECLGELKTLTELIGKKELSEESNCGLIQVREMLKKVTEFVKEIK